MAGPMGQMSVPGGGQQAQQSKPLFPSAANMVSFTPATRLTRLISKAAFSTSCAEPFALELSGATEK